MTRSKFSDDEVVACYKKHGSVWKVAKELGLCGQSVHQRLCKIGANNPSKKYLEAELQKIRDLYNSGFERGDGKLRALAAQLGASVHSVCRFARKMGLTNMRRTCAHDFAVKLVERQKKHIRENGHPRGALGLKHSEETLKIIGKKSELAWKRMTAKQKQERAVKSAMTRDKRGVLVLNNRQSASWKAGWREIGGQRKYFRSRWEANYARFLETLKANGVIAKWEHEAETFWFTGVKRGCVSYLPDFRVTERDGSIYYVEVKGWMDDRSKTKLKRMKKYYPKVKLVLIDSKEYRALEKNARFAVQGWEA